jgi:hypothetical protein
VLTALKDEPLLEWSGKHGDGIGCWQEYLSELLRLEGQGDGDAWQQGAACHVMARMGLCDVRIASEALWSARHVVLHAMSIFFFTSLRCVVSISLNCSSLKFPPLFA